MQIVDSEMHFSVVSGGVPGTISIE